MFLGRRGSSEQVNNPNEREVVYCDNVDGNEKGCRRETDEERRGKKGFVSLMGRIELNGDGAVVMVVCYLKEKRQNLLKPAPTRRSGWVWAGGIGWHQGGRRQ